MGLEERREEEWKKSWYLLNLVLISQKNCDIAENGNLDISHCILVVRSTLQLAFIILSLVGKLSIYAMFLSKNLNILMSRYSLYSKMAHSSNAAWSFFEFFFTHHIFHLLILIHSKKVHFDAFQSQTVWISCQKTKSLGKCLSYLLH